MKKLPQPTSQLEEVLFLLINNNARTIWKKAKGLTRKDFFDKAHVLNSPHAIMILRKRGIDIKTVEEQHWNKFGRKITFCRYLLNNQANAKASYLIMSKAD
jgi:hypothetical protein